MKRDDILFFTGLILFFSPFFFFEAVYDAYYRFNAEQGLIMSYIKFAILATLGEVIGLRIKTGRYYQKGFGLLPRAFVWGFLGVSVKIAFDIFSAGTPVFLEKAGFENASAIIGNELTWKKVIVSFCISTALNLFYAPVLMTFHKITDSHILRTGGSMKQFFQPIAFADILQNIDWDVQWNFVFKKTILLFWIPAQTITFLLPEEFRILFAAFLGVVLGVLLAVASLKGRRE
ncbi:MAG: Mpv17/PMP22 family protein [Bacteroidota bacterium]